MLLFTVIHLVFVLCTTWTNVEAGCSVETDDPFLGFSCSTGRYLLCSGNPSTWDTPDEPDHCALVVDCKGSEWSPQRFLTIPAKLTNGSRGDSVAIHARNCELKTVLIEYRPDDNRKHELVLDLSHNAMTSLADISFDFREDLNVSIRLDGSNNRFVHVNQTTRDWMQKVTDLILNGNQIKEIGEATFEAFPNLVTLSLSDNRLDTFPGSDRPSVQALDLSSNSLTSVDCSLGFFSNLTELRLNNNSIASIGECLPLKKLFARGRTWLADNPLDCCDLRWLQDILLATDNLMDPNDTLCQHPDQFHLAQGSKHDFSCKDDDHNLKVTVGAVLGTFVGLVSAFIIGFLILKWRDTKDKLEISALESQPDSKTVEDKDKVPSDKEGEPRYETPSKPANDGSDAPVIKRKEKTLSATSQASENHYSTLGEVSTHPAAPTGGDYSSLRPVLSPSQRPDPKDKTVYLEVLPTPSPRPEGKKTFLFEPVGGVTQGEKADEDYLQPTPSPSPRPNRQPVFGFDSERLTPKNKPDEDIYLQPSPSPSPRPTPAFGFESELIPLSECDVLYTPKIERAHKSEAAATDVTGSRDKECDVSDECDVSETDVAGSHDPNHVVVHVTGPEADADDSCTSSHL